MGPNSIPYSGLVAHLRIARTEPDVEEEEDITGDVGTVSSFLPNTERETELQITADMGAAPWIQRPTVVFRMWKPWALRSELSATITKQ